MKQFSQHDMRLRDCAGDVTGHLGCEYILVWSVCDGIKKEIDYSDAEEWIFIRGPPRSNSRKIQFPEQYELVFKYETGKGGKHSNVT